jgi:hypothetical protein
LTLGLKQANFSALVEPRLIDYGQRPAAQDYRLTKAGIELSPPVSLLY